MYRYILIFICFFAVFRAEAIDFYRNDIIYSPTGQYTIMEEIGEGVFGRVYSVKNALDQCFALKCYKYETLSTLSDFIMAHPTREFLRGQVLNHDNIIKTHELFAYDSLSNLFPNILILDLVEGWTLLELRKGAIPRRIALREAIHFCDALHYAFSLNYIHLDLHEDNVMITYQNKVMIIDLGSFYTIDEYYGYVESQTQLLEKKFENHYVVNEKIKAFFSQNPKLFEKMVQRNTNFYYAYSLDVTPLFVYYFDKISEFCIYILKKSTMSKDERIAISVEIKKIAWDYAEDAEDGLEKPFDYYYEALIKLLEAKMD